MNTEQRRQIAKQVYAKLTGYKWEHHALLHRAGLRCEVCAHGLSALESALADAYTHGGQDALRWQPIDTAPQNGSSLLLGAMHPDNGFGFICDVGCFIKPTGLLAWNWGWSFAPTHWMPLPAPPADGVSGRLTPAQEEEQG